MEELELEQQEQQEQQEQPAMSPRIPVDITEEEFTDFTMTVASKFGALRMRVPMIVCFVVYMVLIAYLAAIELADSGRLSWPMIVMAVVAIVSALPALIVNPLRAKRVAKETYAAGEENGYFGEIYFKNGEIVKDVGYKQTCLPLSAETMYIETTEFMAFCSVKGTTASIIIPARCLTEETAAMIRTEVFRASYPLQRRVIKRMVARATTPIAYRPMLDAPTTLFEANFAYTPEELADIIIYSARQNFINKLPSLLITAALIGAVLVMMLENVWTFVAAVPAVVLLSFLMSSLNAASAAKRVKEMPSSRLQVTITDRGIDQETIGRVSSVKWRGVKRATEADTFVEFTLNGGLMLRIPKRAIEDMDAFRAIVDRYHKS